MRVDRQTNILIAIFRDTLQPKQPIAHNIMISLYSPWRRVCLSDPVVQVCPVVLAVLVVQYQWCHHHSTVARGRSSRSSDANLMTRW